MVSVSDVAMSKWPGHATEIRMEVPIYNLPPILLSERLQPKWHWRNFNQFVVPCYFMVAFLNPVHDFINGLCNNKTKESFSGGWRAQGISNGIQSLSPLGQWVESSSGHQRPKVVTVFWLFSGLCETGWWSQSLLDACLYTNQRKSKKLQKEMWIRKWNPGVPKQS